MSEKTTESRERRRKHIYSFFLRQRPILCLAGLKICQLAGFKKQAGVYGLARYTPRAENNIFSENAVSYTMWGRKKIFWVILSVCLSDVLFSGPERKKESLCDLCELLARAH